RITTGVLIMDLEDYGSIGDMVPHLFRRTLMEVGSLMEIALTHRAMIHIRTCAISMLSGCISRRIQQIRAIRVRLRNILLLSKLSLQTQKMCEDGCLMRSLWISIIFPMIPSIK